MSFAPSKKSARKESYDSMKHSRYSSYEPTNPQFSQTRSRSTLDSDISSRLDVLDSNMFRISQQQDALLPLQDMVELSSSFSKYDRLVRGVQEKNQENADRLKRVEELLNNYHANIENSLARVNGEQKIPKVDFKPIEKNIKYAMTQMNEKENEITALENNIRVFRGTMHRRIDDEVVQRTQQLENRIDENTEVFHRTLHDLHGGINMGFEKLEDAVKDLYEKVGQFKKFSQTNSNQKFMDDLRDLISKKFQENFEFFREKYNKDIDRLFTEFSILRLEMSSIAEEKRQAKMQPYLQSTLEDINPSERKIKLNNMEQAVYIHELDKFNRENTQRLMYELQTFDEKLDQLKAKYQKYKARVQTEEVPDSPTSKEEWNQLLDETEVVGETYTSLKYQIEGVKKKYFFDMRKIEENMEKILQIKKQVEEEIASNPKLVRNISKELKVTEEFPEKIKNLMEEINVNLTTAFTRLEIVEDKIQENQELLLGKKERYE